MPSSEAVESNASIAEMSAVFRVGHSAAFGKRRKCPIRDRHETYVQYDTNIELQDGPMAVLGILVLCSAFCRAICLRP
ncbi:hypothetical protein BDN67DRAFT_974243 [Paxillus ammoniavirescens]|nr:hypothetical protein BDN67DRAFT_974243 [Paxillus ammoniavirescens]